MNNNFNNKKAYSNNDYLSQLRKNHLYGVDYFDDVEIAEENLEFDYKKEEDKNKKAKKQEGLETKKTNKTKKQEK